MAAARFAGFNDKFTSYLGFRCAPPQALFCRPLSRAKIQHTHFVTKFG
jgi:hypothetical protein